MKKVILNTTRMASERYTLINDGRGMGGCGEAKEHYLNNWVVVSGVDRGNGYQGYYSVDYALSIDHIPSCAKLLIKKTLQV